MTTITRLSANYESRLYVEEDTDAKVLDMFLVTLCPYVPEPGLPVYRKGVGMDELWKEALAAVTYLRAQPWKVILPPNVFQPWATITARNSEDVRRDHDWHMSMLLGREHPDDMERVRHAIRAWDLLHDAPLAVGVPWPDFKGLH